MWTAGIVVFLTIWLATQNVIVSCGLSIGYYAVAAASGFFLRKVSCSPWLCFAVHVAIASCLIAVLVYSRKFKEGESSAQDMPDQQMEPAQSKDDKVRDFALKEAPSVWNAYQVLVDAIEVQNKKIAELRKTLEMFDSNVGDDADVRNLSRVHDEMVASRDAIKAKLEEAYLQARKFAASPDRKEFDELRKKAVEDGVKEAQSALRRYKAMKVPK